MKFAYHWDLFCTVVDNYGDIGVCWRLARQLANEYDLQVRLWVDDLAPLAKLCPDADAALTAQRIDEVEVRLWPQNFPEVEAADVVIEAFACELPERYLSAMTKYQTKHQQAPVWINLEYLSAEDWVEGAHGLASPHPRLPLTKHFFFPGFTAKTGGLIKEADYAKRAEAFDDAAFRTKLGLPPQRSDELTISLFGYENPALPGLLDAWSLSSRPVRCLVPESRLLPEVQRCFAQPGALMQRGNLTVQVIPFLSQQDYDALLWLCDLNFVRGEDSFVRAQWAGKPFVWHIYPQADAAHLLKLNAFLDRYQATLSPTVATAARSFWSAWNDGENIEGAERAWPAFANALPGLLDHAKPWAKQIAAHGDLAANLHNFVLACHSRAGGNPATSNR
jgi:uncharacterized repeat protein (TIGR03837 family)